MRGKNRCYVCFKKHEKDMGYKFPDDMPYKFRWCCGCRSLAKIISRGSVEKTINEYKRWNYGGIRLIRLIKRVKLLDKLIRLI